MQNIQLQRAGVTKDKLYDIGSSWRVEGEATGNKHIANEKVQGGSFVKMSNEIYSTCVELKCIRGERRCTDEKLNPAFANFQTGINWEALQMGTNPNTTW